jgi:fused signal recognition particle receptor
MTKDDDADDRSRKPKPSLFGRLFRRNDAPIGEPDPDTETESDQEPEPAESEIAPPPEPEESAVEEQAAPMESPGAPGARPKGWWSRLRQGLARSSDSIGSGLVSIFTKRKLDGAMLDDLEDVLVRADLGVATAARISGLVGKDRYDKAIEVGDVKQILAAEVERVLSPCARPLEIDAAVKPTVILVVGVNGSGKTTTIGKLAAQFSHEGRRVVLAAGDTFRAAAIEQLRIWGARLGCEVIARAQGSDASALAFDAMRAARETGADVLLMDTAGRLQNRTELMAELEKIIRTMKKVDPAAPHAVLLVLDATVGQNAMSQVEIFGKVAGVTGLVMTKLDGTARGGILVAIAEKFALPIHFIGIGEGANDLAAFEARDFARAIAGLDEETAAAPR